MNLDETLETLVKEHGLPSVLLELSSVALDEIHRQRTEAINDVEMALHGSHLTGDLAKESTMEAEESADRDEAPQ